MPCKTLTRNDITIVVTAFPEEIPVKGNAMCSGDEAFDHQVETEILERLEKDDMWAWATVCVAAEWECLSASEYLGCCCYANEEEFRQEGGYFDDMVHEALSNLNLRLRNLYERMSA
jgi:hypothetical protein